MRSFSAEDPALSWVVAALLGWETLGVVAGGSYWLHYLVGLVPGLTVVLGLALARPDAPRRRGLAARPLASPHRTALGLVVLSTVVGLAGLAVHPPSRPADARAVIGYLRDHAAPGDTGVTAFGDPVLLQQSGVPSAYPDLWSLPVRVHDPRLADLTRLLDGPRRPTWVVVSGGSLASWGLDAGTADPALAEHYERVLTSGGLSVLRRVG